jgi:Zn2+/Cd2+-exporting ATPase
MGDDRLGVLATGATLVGLAAATIGTFHGPAIAALPPGLALAYVAGGLPALVTALQSLFRDRRLDIDLLMVIAALAALAVGEALEGAVLLALFSLSSTLESLAMGRARHAVEALMDLRPETTLREESDGTLREVNTAEIMVGDLLRVRPGDRVPVDAVIAEGAADLDESTITGESLPVHKGAGAQVFEATVNLNGALRLRASRSMAESTVARMVALVTEAQAARAPSERFSEWFGQRYTIAVLAGAILAFATLYALGWSTSDALYRAATLLVAASPCAVVISVPAAILSALAAAARGGVLFKGGAALETMATVNTYAFDKTGTLTTGQAEVQHLLALEGTEADFLALLAGIEAGSEHPIAAAVARAAAARGLPVAPVRNLVAHPSEGLIAEDATGALWAGNPRMAARMGADLSHPALLPVQQGAQTVIYLGRGARVLGVATVADRPRASSAAGLQALRREGIGRIAMLTGDRRAVALRIGAELGLSEDEVQADLLPADKVALIAGYAEAGPVAFVGDGVNDAAALARADVGIAMGAAGSEVALQAADVALLSDDMGRLAMAHALARRTSRIIRQNLVFALGAMVVLVTASLVFALPLPLAVIGHEGGTVLVVLNGLRLLFDPIRGKADRPHPKG